MITLASNAEALNPICFSDTNRATQCTFIQTPRTGKINRIRIDSICEIYDHILQKMPVPTFKRAVRDPNGQMSDDGVPITYDSINAIIAKRGYETKIGPDTLDNIARSILFDPNNPEYSSVTYSDIKSKKVLIKVVAKLNAQDVSIYYYDKKLIRISEVDYYVPIKINNALYQNKMNCYFKKRTLCSAEIKGTYKQIGNIIDERKSITIFCGMGTIFLIYRKLPRSIYNPRY